METGSASGAVAPAGSEPSTWQPVTTGERYAALDVLRGLALFGVLIVNLDMSFRISFGDYVLGNRHSSGKIDEWVALLIALVLQIKAFTLFSFSFGVGTAVQTERTKSRGYLPEWFLARRMLVLLVLGLFHMFVIWNGDILTLYAICGLLLLPLVRLPSPVLALLGILAIGLQFRQHVDIPVGQDQWTRLTLPVNYFVPNYETYQQLAAEAREAHAEGSYWHIMSLSRREAVSVTAPLLLSVLPKTLGLMLLGMAAWRSGLLKNPERHRWLLAAILVVAGGLGAAATAIPRYWPSIAHSWRLPGEVWEACSFLPLALGYAAAVFLCFGSQRTRLLGAPLAAVGQMALTNYLAQSVILGLLFYGYGFGLIGKLGPAWASLIGLGLYVVQSIFSLTWLSYFQFGPVEWLWRSFTYGRWQPFRRTHRILHPEVSQFPPI
jgi:uncharacterized protein